ncbi:hypothetical protein PybrP1_012800, partial [[Pythium] brassicae (nom. inval.)]
RCSRLISSSTAPLSTAPHFFSRVLEHQNALALIESPRDAQPAREWTFAGLLARAVRLRDTLAPQLRSAGSGATPSNRQPRVAFLGARGAAFVEIQWAIWLTGGIAVPLHARHPPEELAYILADCGAALLVASDEFVHSPHLSEFLRRLPRHDGVPVHVHAEAGGESRTPLSDRDTDEIRQWVATHAQHAPAAQIVYTSGTTGRPKGVVTTHANLTAQIHDVVAAWEMSPRDHLLHFLPLHHVHGVLNNLLCVHYAGGSLEFLPSAEPSVIWSKLAASLTAARPVTMLMAVPTVYMLLLEEMERLQAQPPGVGSSHRIDVDRAIEAARGLRVAVSGSMACPVSILTRWHALTGQTLLERYGMTELGMVLTNPLHGERHLGYVGQSFPSVAVRLVDPDTEREVALSSEREGELRVKGPTVFEEYWGKPAATAKEFDESGWFKTGDIAQFSNERQSFRIRGRASADIIKSAGYKISALDVERVLLTHPQVQECAVFGLPDEKWGQVVAAVVRASTTEPPLENAEQFSPPLRAFVTPHLADNAAPRRFFFVSEIPKNAMGKVNKKALTSMFVG